MRRRDPPHPALFSTINKSGTTCFLPPSSSIQLASTSATSGVTNCTPTLEILEFSTSNRQVRRQQHAGRLICVSPQGSFEIITTGLSGKSASTTGIRQVTGLPRGSRSRSGVATAANRAVVETGNRFSMAMTRSTASASSDFSPANGNAAWPPILSQKRSFHEKLKIRPTPAPRTHCASESPSARTTRPPDSRTSPSDCSA